MLRRNARSGGHDLLPSPLRGRVGDGGVSSAPAVSASGSPHGRHPVRTPTPDPSPQGGGGFGGARRKSVSRSLRSLIVALLMLAAPTLATAKPIEVRVVIVTTWNVDLNGKDTYGELHAWRTRWPLTTELPFPLGVHPLLYDAKRHVLAILTGEATARAAASITALGADP